MVDIRSPIARFTKASSNNRFKADPVLLALSFLCVWWQQSWTSDVVNCLWIDELLYVIIENENYFCLIHCKKSIVFLKAKENIFFFILFEVTFVLNNA